MTGRPKNEEPYVKRTLNIYTKNDMNMNKIIANQHPGERIEKNRSDMTNKALEEYHRRYYHGVLGLEPWKD